MAKKSTPVLSRANLWSLEEYEKRRPSFQADVLAHKKNRTVHLGNNLSIAFEDEMTIRYRLQELMRLEETNDFDAIQDEIDAYVPLIPDGSNLKATLTIEFADDEERRRLLPHLIGIEDRVWIQVEGSSKVYSISDDDAEQEDFRPETEHHLRFELTKEMKAALKYGVGLAVGVDHPRYKAAINPLPQAIRNALVADLK